MENTLELIAQEAMAPVSSSSAGLKTGKDTAAFSLYEAFVIAAQKDARIDILRALYLEGYSPTEFDNAVKQSIQHAATADKQAGWVVALEAKGRKAYGPKQNAMVQRASEMRQIFGYYSQIKAAPQAGYLESLKAAREYLKENGTQWDGSKAPTTEERTATKQTKALAEATKQAMLTVAKLPDETTGQWFARVAQEAEKIVAQAADKAIEEKATKAAQNILDSFEVLDSYSIGLALMRAAIDAGAISQDLAIADIVAAE